MIRVLSGQSIFDLAIQSAGSAEAAFEMALLNGVSITDDLAGMELTEPAPMNRLAVNYYKQNGILPATSDLPDFEAPEREGIGYWAIGNDFIIEN
jgi:hypothetical protein